MASLTSLKFKGSTIFPQEDAEAVAATLEESGANFEDLMNSDIISDEDLNDLILKKFQRRKFLSLRNEEQIAGTAMKTDIIMNEALSEAMQHLGLPDEDDECDGEI